MTSKSTAVVFSAALVLAFVLGVPASGQTGKGAISGRVVDSGGAVLQGARVELQPSGATAITNQQGEFTIYGLTTGQYEVTINYVGFAMFSGKVSVTAGKITRLDESLQVASKNEEIMVYAERVHGEAEALNRQRESDNILQVLPVGVITSLPNTNIADALGRMPSVTLERDEGEGKYVQIRGAEPRYNSVTIDGMELASPESVRQIKLDIVPANLVDSVEINKTLSANQDADAIGGSVNLVTKSAEEKPTFYLNGIGGYTPIVGGRTLSEFDGTVGQRFGEGKKLGILFGASYDWNGRGINDIEPGPVTIACGGGCNNPNATAPYFATYSGMDLRDYKYYRTRYGFTGTIDYKLGDVSGLYLRFLYSHFDNFGDRWVYSPSVGTWLTPTLTNTDASMSANVSIRRPVQVIGSLQAGGKNVVGKWLALYEFGASRASSEDHGYASADFDGTGPAFSNLQFAIDPNIHTPGFIPQGGTSIYDPSQYTLTDLDVSTTYSPQVNLSVAGSVARNYKVGGHFGTFEFGGKFRNAHKFQDSSDPVYDSVNNPPMTSFLGSFKDPSYYDGRFPGAYTLPSADYGKIKSYFNANVSDPAIFTLDAASTAQDQYPNNYDLIERVSGGYAMNTLQFGRVRLQTGVRFEGTKENLLGYQVSFDSNGFLCPGPTPPDSFCQGISNPVVPVRRSSSYLDVFPSAQLKFTLGRNSAIRASYGRGIARPDFGDLPPTFNAQGNNNEVDIGNPDLKPTRANNFDVLFEQYLKPLGVIQTGVFYKDISEPIFFERSLITPALAAQNPQYANYVGGDLVQPINGSAGHLVGFEVAYQQHMTFLPGFLSGFGLSANYSYTSSSAKAGPNRTDDPAFQRQAPNTGNFSPTYDRGRLSARLGVTYNGPNIFQYQYANLNSDGTPNPVPLGLKGPNGDIYLYQHTQVDLQTSFRMYKGLQFIFAGLNLTNEVFGFYAGSPAYPIQREYYKPSYQFGVRYVLASEQR